VATLLIYPDLLPGMADKSLTAYSMHLTLSYRLSISLNKAFSLYENATFSRVQRNENQTKAKTNNRSSRIDHWHRRHWRRRRLHCDRQVDFPAFDSFPFTSSLQQLIFPTSLSNRHVYLLCIHIGEFGHLASRGFPCTFSSFYICVYLTDISD
jgi:hypothetical protein